MRKRNVRRVGKGLSEKNIDIGGLGAVLRELERTGSICRLYRSGVRRR